MAETTTYVCARCGVNAAPLGTRWINKDGRTLDFCGHHTDEHGPALERQKWTKVEVSVLLDEIRTGAPVQA